MAMPRKKNKQLCCTDSLRAGQCLSAGSMILYWLVVPWLVHVIVFWTTVWVVEGHPHTLVDTEKCLQRVLTNQLIVHPTLALLASPAVVAGALSPIQLQGITLSGTLWALAAYMCIEEVGFYYLHRMLHCVPLLNERVHSLHHRWHDPVGMAALDAHPIEHALLNLLPLGCGPPLVALWRLEPGCQLLAHWIMVVAASVNTVLAHQARSTATSHFHREHHRLGSKNFGVLGLCDLLHGTYK